VPEISAGRSCSDATSVTSRPVGSLGPASDAEFSRPKRRVNKPTAQVGIRRDPLFIAAKVLRRRSTRTSHRNSDKDLVGSKGGPFRILVHFCDSLVHLAQERFIPTLFFQASIHTDSSTPMWPGPQVRLHSGCRPPRSPRRPWTQLESMRIAGVLTWRMFVVIRSRSHASGERGAARARHPGSAYLW
jgi:hypothetical protein